MSWLAFAFYARMMRSRLTFAFYARMILELLNLCENGMSLLSFAFYVRMMRSGLTFAFFAWWLSLFFSMLKWWGVDYAFAFYAGMRHLPHWTLAPHRTAVWMEGMSSKIIFMLFLAESQLRPKFLAQKLTHVFTQFYLKQEKRYSRSETQDSMFSPHDIKLDGKECERTCFHVQNLVSWGSGLKWGDNSVLEPIMLAFSCKPS